jgi:hypothetical protein
MPRRGLAHRGRQRDPSGRGAAPAHHPRPRGLVLAQQMVQPRGGRPVDVGLLQLRRCRSLTPLSVDSSGGASRRAAAGPPPARGALGSGPVYSYYTLPPGVFRYYYSTHAARITLGEIGGWPACSLGRLRAALQAIYFRDTRLVKLKGPLAVLTSQTRFKLQCIRLTALV